jgi:hypothetical protein
MLESLAQHARVSEEDAQRELGLTLYECADGLDRERSFAEAKPALVQDTDRCFPAATLPWR